MRTVKELAPFPKAPGEIEITTVFHDVNDRPYMEQLKHSVKAAWHPPKCAGSKKAVVFFRLQEDGSVSDLKLLHPSNDRQFDRAAVDAVRNAAPFGRMPDGSDRSNDVVFPFDYHVLHGRMSPEESKLLKSL